MPTRADTYRDAQRVHGNFHQPGDDLALVDCGVAREALSAALDGEDSPTTGLEAHLAGCKACTAWQEQAARITRLAAVAPADPCPDLAATVLAKITLPRPSKWRMSLRAALVLVAAAQVVVGLVELMSGGHMAMTPTDGMPSGHINHETSAFNLAVGVVLLWVAFDTRRAKTQLPLLVSFVGVLVAISTVDLVESSVGWSRLVTHVPVLLGLLLTLVLSRSGGPGTERGSRTTSRPSVREQWRLLMNTRTHRVATVSALVVGGLLATTASAAAHVTAQPSTAPQGGYTKIAFRVPNEQDKAATSSVEVTFPSDHPIASVETRALPGWTVKVDKSPLAKPLTTDDGQISEAVSKVTWTGGKITPGSFEDFEVSLGPLPTDTTKLVFKAVQTYDNGDVVRWINASSPGGAEPEHPAPTVTLTPKTASPAVTPTAATTTESSTGTASLVLSIVGAVLALLAAVFAGLAWRRTRESA